MTPEALAKDWPHILTAYALVQKGTVKRIDGDERIVYSVGSNVVRIDVRVAT